MYLCECYWLKLKGLYLWEVKLCGNIFLVRLSHKISSLFESETPVKTNNLVYSPEMTTGTSDESAGGIKYHKIRERVCLHRETFEKNYLSAGIVM